MSVGSLPSWSSLVLIGIATLGVAGCTVRETTPDSITVEHDALHPEFGQIEANQYCQQLGKTPVLVATRPGTPSLSTMMLNSTISTYRCVGGVGSVESDTSSGTR